MKLSVMATVAILLGSQICTAEIRDFEVPGVFETGICTYHTSLRFIEFPDYEIFTTHMSNNEFTKDNFVVADKAGLINPVYSSHVEVAKHAYILHIKLARNEPMNDDGKCGSKKVRVFIR